MNFHTQQERLQWLQEAATRISQMEQERKICIMSGDFKQAFSLLKGIKFARAEFANQSKKYAKK